MEENRDEFADKQKNTKQIEDETENRLITLCHKMLMEKSEQENESQTYSDEELSSMIWRVNKFPFVENLRQLQQIPKLLGIESHEDFYKRKKEEGCDEFGSVWTEANFDKTFTNIANLTEEQRCGIRLATVMYEKTEPYMDDVYKLGELAPNRQKKCYFIDKNGKETEYYPFFYELLDMFAVFVDFRLFYKFNLQPIINALDELTNRPTLNQPVSPIYLTKRTGEKTDFLRVINALYEIGMFTDEHGNKAIKKDVFSALGNAVNLDLSDYTNLLSKAKRSKNSDGNTQQTQIFDRLKEISIEKTKK
jgi:hypothetical protein